MIQKAVFLLLNICLLVIIVGASVRNTAKVDLHDSFQVENQHSDNDENEALISDSYVVSYHPKCILSENKIEEDQAEICFIKLSPIPTFTFYNNANSIDRILLSKSKIHKLLEGNMTPVQNVSRNILFHSLQIHF